MRSCVPLRATMVSPRGIRSCVSRFRVCKARGGEGEVLQTRHTDIVGVAQRAWPTPPSLPLCAVHVNQRCFSIPFHPRGSKSHCGGTSRCRKLTSDDYTENSRSR